MERKKDLLVATILTPTESSYKRFVNENKKGIWTKVNGKIVRVSYLFTLRCLSLTKMGWS